MTSTHTELVTLNEQTHSQRVELAGEAALVASSRHPLPSDWAMLVFDDRAPVFCGAGMGCFLWFEDKAAMEGFLAHQLPFFVDSGLEDEESSQIAQELAQLWMDGANEPLDVRIEALNKRLHHLVNVEWAGPVSELLEAPGKAEGFRTWYRNTAGIEVDSSPIPLVQQDHFLQALTEYGI